MSSAAGVLAAAPARHDELERAMGVSIQGRNVTKARIDEYVGVNNDIRLLMNGFGTVADARTSPSPGPTASASW